MRLRNGSERVQPTHSDPSPLRYRAMMDAAGSSTVSYRTDFVEAHAVSPEIAHLGAWLRFDFRPPETRMRGGAGWKVHVSVDVGQAAEAWDAILPVVSAARLLCKAVGPAITGSIGDPWHRQAGKAIVLYGHGHPLAGDTVFWQGVLEDVEGALASAGVRPGWTVAGDRPVPGSAYAYVRNDASEGGGYSEAGAWFNPTGAPCPFDGVSLRPNTGTPIRRSVGTDALRQLRMVGGNLRAERDAIVLDDEAGRAGTLCKALGASGIGAVRAATGLALPASEAVALRRGWFRAMQAYRAAEVGRLVSVAWHDVSGGGASITARLATAGGDRPCCVLGFGTSEGAEAFAAAFDRPRALPGAATEGSRAVVPLPPWAFDGTEVDPRVLGRAVETARASLPASGPAGPRP